MKIFFAIIGALILLTVGGFLLNIIMYPVQTAGNLVNTAYDANNTILNADNAIYNYEWFKQKKADIDAAKKTRDNAVEAQASFRLSAGARSDWTFEDKQEDARLGAVILGSENYLEGLIGDYNARASMATRNIFEDHLLPNFIDALTFIRK